MQVGAAAFDTAVEGNVWIIVDYHFNRVPFFLVLDLNKGLQLLLGPTHFYFLCFLNVFADYQIQLLRGHCRAQRRPVLHGIFV